MITVKADDSNNVETDELKAIDEIKTETVDNKEYIVFTRKDGPTNSFRYHKETVVTFTTK